MFGEKTRALQKRAEATLPLGVNSNFRYWGEEITPYVQKAKGAYLWDVDGKKYIDYRMAFGPIILGHSYDEVDRKVIEEIQNGILFAGLDVIGDYLTEINITSPTCIRELDKIYNLDIAGQLMNVIAAKLKPRAN